MIRFALVLLVCSCAAAEPVLREAFDDDFLIGVALNTSQVDGRNPAASKLAARQFSAVTAENDFKWQGIHPAPGRYRFDAADAYLAFAEKRRMKALSSSARASFLRLASWRCRIAICEVSYQKV